MGDALRARTPHSRGENDDENISFLIRFPLSQNWMKSVTLPRRFTQREKYSFLFNLLHRQKGSISAAFLDHRIGSICFLHFLCLFDVLALPIYALVVC